MEEVVVDPAFWAGRRIFLTGHTGFKGSWLLMILRELGANVTGFSLEPPTDPSMFALLGLADTCTHLIGDIRDLAGVQGAIEQADPEVLIHMAAQPLVRASYRSPVETYATNLMGTVHVLEACRQAPSLRAAVFVTTDKCYENNGWVWGYRENDRLGGADPYSNSKAVCELAVDSYRRSFFKPNGARIATARAGNVIGGGDFAADRLVPDAMRAFRARERLRMRNELAVRPWQHVLEPLHGYLLLAERLATREGYDEAWNFGPATDEAATVGEVVNDLAGQWGGDAAWEQDPDEHPHEAATLKLDSTKARLELGWHPRLSLPTALAMTAEWYRVLAQAGDLRMLTQAQIRSYRSEEVS